MDICTHMYRYKLFVAIVCISLYSLSNLCIVPLLFIVYALYPSILNAYSLISVDIANLYMNGIDSIPQNGAMVLAYCARALPYTAYWEYASPSVAYQRAFLICPYICINI